MAILDYKIDSPNGQSVEFFLCRFKDFGLNIKEVGSWTKKA